MSFRFKRWPLLLTGLVALCGLITGSLWLLQPASPAAPSPEQRARRDRLTAARQRWATLGPQHYRLAIAQIDLGLRCEALVEIRDTAIVAVEQNTCQTPPSTVDDLFQLIERHTTERICGPNGCPCDGVLVADATYDPALGYPQQVSITPDPSQRTPWPLRERLRHALQGGGWDALTGASMACTAIGMIDPQLEVLSLTPLP
ncbi:MAG TPA: DUF6174 domain-containing protein [Herpetosiphonaceae bacterium]